VAHSEGPLSSKKTLADDVADILLCQLLLPSSEIRVVEVIGRSCSCSCFSQTGLIKKGFEASKQA
jgi:hypothetical protein